MAVFSCRAGAAWRCETAARTRLYEASSDVQPRALDDLLKIHGGFQRAHRRAELARQLIHAALHMRTWADEHAGRCFLAALTARCGALCHAHPPHVVTRTAVPSHPGETGASSGACALHIRSTPHLHLPGRAAVHKISSNRQHREGARLLALHLPLAPQALRPRVAQVLQLLLRPLVLLAQAADLHLVLHDRDGPAHARAVGAEATRKFPDCCFTDCCSTGVGWRSSVCGDGIHMPVRAVHAQVGAVPLQMGVQVFADGQMQKPMRVPASP